MLKFLIFAGALVWLIFGYGGDHPANSQSSTKSRSAPIAAPWSGAVGSLGKTFWEDQAKAGTALWHRSLTWCEQKFQDSSQPTLTDGVCTLILGIRADMEKTNNG